MSRSIFVDRFFKPDVVRSVIAMARTHALYNPPPFTCKRFKVQLQGYITNIPELAKQTLHVSIVDSEGKPYMIGFGSGLRCDPDGLLWLEVSLSPPVVTDFRTEDEG
jgi:hypothetical protein